MMIASWWRQMPRAAAGPTAVIVVAWLVTGCGVMPGAAGRSHAANTAARQIPEGAGVRYHGVIGATPSAVETDAQAPAPPPINPAVYEDCTNPDSFGPLNAGAAAYLAGWSDVSKLGGSAPLGFPALGLAQGEGANEGFFTQAAGPVMVNGDAYDCVTLLLQLDYGGQREFPPLTATFTAFGFVPVTATVYLTQAGSSPLTSVVYTDYGPPTPAGPGTHFSENANNPFQVVSAAQVGLRLADVKVNGVPLDVGADCHTDGVLTSPNPLGYHGLVLTGGGFPGDPLPQYLTAEAGGGMAGEATIPPFTGCSTPGGENVDALLDASVSGPGNYVTLAAGALCNWTQTPPYGPGQCAPASAPPFQPQFEPLWTVTDGGPYAATGPVTFSEFYPRGNTTTITCAGSQISGTIPDDSGVLRTPLIVGTLDWIFSGCTGSDGSAWTITQEGSAYLAAGLGTSTDAAGFIEGLDLDLTGTNVPGSTGSCTAELTYGATGFDYQNDSSTLLVAPALIGEDTLGISASTCADLPPTNTFVTVPLGPSGQCDFCGYPQPVHITATYALRPGGTIMTSP
jgi:hypothetical protein